MFLHPFKITPFDNLVVTTYWQKIPLSLNTGRDWGKSLFKTLLNCNIDLEAFALLNIAGKIASMLLQKS